MQGIGISDEVIHVTVLKKLIKTVRDSSRRRKSSLNMSGAMKENNNEVGDEGITSILETSTKYG